MRVLTWNVQGAVPPFGSKDRIRSQVEFIDKEVGRPDLLLLNEVTTAQRDFWHGQLDEIGYEEIVDTLDWASELGDSEVPPHQEFNHVNGNLIAIHESSALGNLRRIPARIREGPVGDSVLKHWDTNFPEKILNAQVEYGELSIDLWNIRAVPGSMYGEEKIKILENTYGRILAAGERPRILAGDFNGPKAETAEGEIVSWGVDRDGALGERWTRAELDILTGLEEVGMVDVFRAVNGYGELDVLDVSHPTQGGERLSGKRFDHLFASESFCPESCRYVEGGFECSDHAPLVASFASKGDHLEAD